MNNKSMRNKEKIKNEKETLSFELSVKRIEEIAEEMENADLDLDKALALFSEGTNLIKQCSQQLKETKNKIEILLSDGKKETFEEKE
jgi:exodeoxyribonuclease VII small subunit